LDTRLCICSETDILDLLAVFMSAACILDMEHLPAHGSLITRFVFILFRQTCPKCLSCMLLKPKVRLRMALTPRCIVQYLLCDTQNLSGGKQV